MRKINTFWNWFQDNNQSIKNLNNETPTSQKNICYWLNRHLGYYCKGLDFIIVFPKKEKEKAELIITANGNPEYFNQVIELINNAPLLKHWKFKAFIQQTENIDKIIKGLDEPYIFPEITLKTSEIKFLPLAYYDENKKINITVYLKNYHLHCNSKTWEQAFYIIVQYLSGEKPVNQNINFIQLSNISEQVDDEMIYLYDLQFYIDDINSDKK